MRRGHHESKTIINLDFLRSDSAQSTMRVVVLIIGIAVTLNLLAMPFLLFYAIQTKAVLSWVPGYIAGLGGLSGAGLIGKALQKRYEGDEYNSYDNPYDVSGYSTPDTSSSENEDPLPKGPNGQTLTP